MKAPSFWYKKNIISYCLWPLSLVYYVLLNVDRAIKCCMAYRSTLPVISVGNITVGGSGKSPVVGYIAKKLIDQGEEVAILSRGYGAKIAKSRQVQSTDGALEVGDEPLMLKQQLPQAQVWVGSNRKDSARKAEKAGATCILLDDGFQHWSLKRDIDIVLIDALQGMGNGFMLPAGCLREPAWALKRADIIVGMEEENRFSNISLNLSVNNSDIRRLKDKKILAFSGIGVPKKFFASLVESGLRVVAAKSFPDHYFYTEEDLKALKKQAEADNLTLATTAKDAVKLPEGYAEVVDVQITGDTAALMDAVTAAIIEKKDREKA
jgi:tetraacyldisaccharide 4'-kinase